MSRAGSTTPSPADSRMASEPYDLGEKDQENPSLRMSTAQPTTDAIEPGHQDVGAAQRSVGEPEQPEDGQHGARARHQRVAERSGVLYPVTSRQAPASTVLPAIGQPAWGQARQGTVAARWPCRAPRRGKPSTTIVQPADHEPQRADRFLGGLGEVAEQQHREDRGHAESAPERHREGASGSLRGQTTSQRLRLGRRSHRRG